MKIILTIGIVVFLLYGGNVVAQETPLGTSRSEDLQIKARMDYERRNQKPSSSKIAPTQNTVTPTQNAAPTMPQKPLPSVTSSHAYSGSGVEKQTRVVCKNGGEIRDLYVEYKGQGCELFYTKLGSTKSQARQSNGTSVCESVFEKMKATVEKSGFVCEQKEN
ncbi:MAG: hypothetical protein JNL11_11100 [Bdellovibrionaceae bacterium]|nr:hypothetical protein [Pseudobdellovibrionaceae bacterium]